MVLAAIGQLGVAGGQGYVLEYTGAAIEALTMEGRMTVCNMSIEAGARAGMIAPDDTTYAYLEGREHAPQGPDLELAIESWRTLTRDPEAPFDRGFTFDGTDIRDLSLAELRGAIGIVPQEPTLFSGTIRENIAYAGIGDDGSHPAEEAVRAAAKAAHAVEFIERLPDGFDTHVGERGVKLSGGQRQRIAIARVFLKNPALVILDEATSSLDSESERLVEQAMEDLLRARSTLIIAHRLSTVLRADRVVVIDRGVIVEEGRHQELLASEGVYSRLYRGQFRPGDALSGTAAL